MLDRMLDCFFIDNGKGNEGIIKVFLFGGAGQIWIENIERVAFAFGESP